MRTDTHTIVTIKWKENEYPSAWRRYTELDPKKKNQRGKFMHEMLKAYETSLTNQEEDAEELILLREIKAILLLSDIEKKQGSPKTGTQKKQELKTGIVRQYKR